jgi:hypothetical protein
MSILTAPAIPTRQWPCFLTSRDHSVRVASVGGLIHFCRPSPFIVRMHPRVRRDFALHRQLDHVNWRRKSRGPARPAFQRRFEFPDWRVARTADMFKRNAGACFAAVAFHLQPAVTAVEALRDGRRRLDRSAKASICSDQSRHSAASAARTASLAHSRACDAT